MTKHFLCLNEDKTEVLVLGSEYYIPKLSIPTVVIGNEQLVPGNKLEILASILTQPSISWNRFVKHAAIMKHWQDKEISG